MINKTLTTDDLVSDPFRLSSAATLLIHQQGTIGGGKLRLLYSRSQAGPYVWLNNDAQVDGTTDYAAGKLVAAPQGWLRVAVVDPTGLVQSDVQIEIFAARVSTAKLSA